MRMKKAQPRLQPNEIQNNNLNDGLSKLAEAASKDLDSLNAQYTHLVSEPVFHGNLIGTSSPALDTQPNSSSAVPTSAPLTGSIQPLHLPETTYQRENAAGAPPSLPKHAQLFERPQGTTALEPEQAIKTHNHEPRVVVDTVPNQSPLVVHGSLDAAGHDARISLSRAKRRSRDAEDDTDNEDATPMGHLKPELKLEDPSRLGTRGNGRGGMRQGSTWRIETDGSVIAQLKPPKRWRMNKTILRQLMNAPIPTKSCSTACEVLYQKAGKDQVTTIYSAMIIVRQEPSADFYLQFSPEFYAMLQEGNSSWVTLKSVSPNAKRSSGGRGEKLQIELVAMHQTCPYKAQNQSEDETYDHEEEGKQEQGKINAVYRKKKDGDGDLAPMSTATTIVKRAKTQHNINVSQPSHRIIIRNPDEFHPAQQQHVASTATSFDSFLASKFSMSFKELMALPELLQWMQSSGTLAVFENYMRSGQPNAQQVLQEAFEHHSKTSGV